MSANIISSLTEENRDLQKQMQIGCMNGIFQLFDRHYFVTGRRVSSSHNHKRLLQGANHSKESKAATNKAIVKKDLDLALKHKPRVSDESPRTDSPSFSCTSTSASTLDGGNKTVHSGPPHSDQSNSFQSPTGTPRQQKNPLLHSSHRSVDLRDVIKDSMQREHRALSVKTAGKEERRDNTMKHIDSPRPSPQVKSGQQRVARLDGSIHTLPEPQQAPRSSREEKDAPLRRTQKDLPRFSCDGRETRDAFKSSTKLKDLPRLSLDSRESSLRSSVSESRLHFILRDLKRDNGNTTQTSDMNQEPGSNKRPPSNVVVKLMGLEAFPDSEDEVTKFHARPDRGFQMKSSDKASEKNTQPRAFSPLNVQKDPATPHLRSTGVVTKPASNSKFPLEPAPWRQPDASQDAPRTVNGSISSSATHASTVYGEIEKRITELEFRKSGKDLRALKQILEAMQKSRKRIEIQNREESDLESETSKSSLDYIRGNQVTRASNCQRNQSYPLGQSKGSSSRKRLNASTIISKGARSTNSSSTAFITTDAAGHQRLQTQNTPYRREDSAKDLTPRNSAPKGTNAWNSYTNKKRTGKPSKAVQTSRAPQLVKAENYAAFGRTSGSISPRFQGKKPGTEKQYRATSPSTEPSKGRRKSGKPPAESNSLTRNVKPQSTSLQRGNYKVSSNNNTRNISHQGDTASVQSESNSSLASQMEMEITSTSSIEIGVKPKIKPKEKDFAARLNEDMTFAELAIPATEQPSPVSILDATFYREDSPSPVKKISTAFQEYGTPELDEVEWDLDNLDQVRLMGSKTGDEFNQKEIEKVENLVRRLILLATSHDEASMSRIATLCRSPNPDHRYITKLLLASGLIKGSNTFSTAIQLHSSGHVINPNLYHVLEQTEQYIELANQEHERKFSPSKSEKKIHRKILFDTVNEILARKLASENPFVATRRKIKTEEELLMELYSEIDHLQAFPDCNLEDDDDLGCIPGEWADCRGEIPALVLDIERLIFKDLITEVLTDEGVGMHDWPKRQGRKLFTEY